jgi:uncharacterized protein YbjT (DUF2867 family)
MKGQSKILVLGASGMLGHALFSLLSVQEDLDVRATARTADGLARSVQTW